MIGDALAVHRPNDGGDGQRRQFLDSLLDGRDVGALAARAEWHGVILPGAHIVAAAQASRPFGDGDDVVAAVEQGIAARFGRRDVVVCTKDGLLVCLAPDQPSTVIDEFGALLGEALGSAPGWRVGVGRRQSGPAGICRSFGQARAALEIGERLDLPERILYSHDLLVFEVLRRDGAALVDLVAEVLEPLRAARTGPMVLLETLHAYFLTGGVATATAHRLGVGVRTVTYRLQRVKELTGYAVDDPEQAFTLQTAVFGARLIGWPDDAATS